MRRNKASLQRKGPKIRNFAIKIIGSVLIIFLALFLLIGYIWKVITTSNYFKVTEITTKDVSIPGLSYLKGRNIFAVDLKKESEYLLGSFPSYSNVRLVRILPNRIFVDFIKRRPFAYLKLYRYFAVDERGVLFDAPATPEGAGLPIIVGLQTKISSPKSGSRYNLKELALCLNLIREFKRSHALRNYQIQEINVAYPANTSMSIVLPSRTADLSGNTPLALPQSLEVKIGAENIRAKIAILSSVFVQGRKNLSNINYIDLRFKDPVIKFKDVK